jgi:chromosome partitioning protein
VKVLKIVTLFNIKGGIGKTSLTSLIAYKLANEGKKILIIDADLQANMTQFMYKSNHTDKTIVNAIRDNTTAEELIIKAPNNNYPGVDLIPADIELCVLAEHMALDKNKNKLVALWFRNNLEVFKTYDYIFVDLSPSIDLLNRNFLYICDSIIVPINHGDLASIRGAELFNILYLQEAKKLGFGANTKIALLKNCNKKYNRKMLHLFDEQLQKYKFSREHLLETSISESTTIQQAVLMRTGLEDLEKKYKNKKIQEQIDDIVIELKSKEII